MISINYAGKYASEDYSSTSPQDSFGAGASTATFRVEGGSSLPSQGGRWKRSPSFSSLFLTLGTILLEFAGAERSSKVRSNRLEKRQSKSSYCW